MLTGGEVGILSSRIFQSVIVQMKDATSRAIGVVDQDGAVVASSDLSMVGSSISVPQFYDDAGAGVIKSGGMTFKAMGDGIGNDYAVFAEGSDDFARTICLMTAVAINEARVYFDENHGKRAFVKNIISENILPGDLYVRAKELRFDSESARGVLVVRHGPAPDNAVADSLLDSLLDRQRDFVISVSDTDIALIKEMPNSGDLKYLMGIAETIEQTLFEKFGLKTVIGIGTPARNIRELAAKFKEAQLSIDIGRVF
jgi:carbohydrate diacid regulator